MVAGYAARQFVEAGLDPGALAIISSDSLPPYERPPLSKGLLAGRDQPDDILINPPSFYADHGIALMLDTPATRVDFDARRIDLDQGDPVRFETLVIATGARPRALDIPGASLDGVRYLRDVRDSTAIRAAAIAIGAGRAVMVGGGFIAMEVSSVLASQGVDVTMVFPDERVWKRLFTPEISAFFAGYFKSRGVRIEPGQLVTRIDGSVRVEAVRTSTGARIPAGLVVAGIGIEPNASLFDGTPLRQDRGIVADEYLATNMPGVFAAGDVVRYRDLLFGKLRRADHWDNAVEQGKYLATLLTAGKHPFVHVPYFFSDVFDLSYEFWGDAEGATSVIYRGDVSSGAFSAWWQRRETVIAAFVMGRPDEERELAPQWIAERQDVPPAALRDAPTLREIELR